MSKTLIENWDDITPSLFEGIDPNNKEALDERVKELFTQWSATRVEKPEPADKRAYNSLLHQLLGTARRAYVQQTKAAKKVAVKDEAKIFLRQKIKSEGKAKADKGLFVDAVLAQLEDAGVDLSPLNMLLEGQPEG